MTEKRTLRIGGACAFWGDSNQGVQQLVQHGDVDVLVFDYLAELTMSILANARKKNPQAGYATDFITAVAPHLPQIVERNTIVLSNAGGMNPHACAASLQNAARAAGIKLRIAVVEGDDLLTRQDEIRSQHVKEMFSGAAMPDALTSIHAYLGAFPIVSALERGADVVITGRCADSALALAALIHHFKWSPEDFDKLAAGSLVGHMLECTTQATGGLFTDWWRVPGWENMGYPIAECESDGTFVLAKPPGTGGLITPLVASEQLLYEVTDPANYLLPDVSCDFTGVEISEVGKNRVRISGARGNPPTSSYKVSGTWHDGYRLSSTLTFVGEHAIEKARRAGHAVIERTRRMLGEAGLADYTDVNIEVLGSEIPSYGHNAIADSREVVLRISARHTSQEGLKPLSQEIAPLGTAGAPGTTGFSGRSKPQPVFRLFSFLWPKTEVDVRVEIDDDRRRAEHVQTTLQNQVTKGDSFQFEQLPQEDRVELPLSSISVARSGDKADIAHVAVIARKPKFARLIAEQLTPDAVAQWFETMVRGSVTRYEVPGVSAFNFVLQQALGGGGAASLRNDPLGKTFAQILLSRPVSVPRSWVPETDGGYQKGEAGQYVD